MTDDRPEYPEYRPRRIDLEFLNDQVRWLRAMDCGDAATLIVELLAEVECLRLEHERMETAFHEYKCIDIARQRMSQETYHQLVAELDAARLELSHVKAALRDVLDPFHGEGFCSEGDR